MICLAVWTRYRRVTDGQTNVHLATRKKIKVARFYGQHCMYFIKVSFDFHQAKSSKAIIVFFAITTQFYQNTRDVYHNQHTAVHWNAAILELFRASDHIWLPQKVRDGISNGSRVIMLTTTPAQYGLRRW